MINTDTAKAEAVKRCLASARQLGIDMAYLLPCDLSGVENQLLRSAYGNLEDLLVNLNGIHNGKRREETGEHPPVERQREHGGIKL